MPSTARPVVSVEVSLMLRNGKRPVRINHRPSKSIPRFLPAKLFVSAIFVLLFEMRLIRNYAQLFNFRQDVNKFFGQSVTEVFVLLVGAHVDKRQHRDGGRKMN